MIDITQGKLCLPQCGHNFQSRVPQAVKNLFRLVLCRRLADGIFLADFRKNIAQHLSRQADAHPSGRIAELHLHIHNDDNFIQPDNLAQRGIDVCFAVGKLNGYIILPAAPHNGHHVVHQVFIQPQLQIRVAILGGRCLINRSVAAQQPVHHTQRSGSREIEHHRRVLFLPLHRCVYKRQDIAFRQSVGEFIVPLLLNTLHGDLAVKAQPRVQPGINDTGIVFKNAVEHLNPVLGKFPRTAEIIFPVFLLLLFLRRFI